MGRRTPRSLVTVPLLTAALVLTGCSGGDGGTTASAPSPTSSAPVSPAPAAAAAEFLADHVDPDGRVVRRDQGGDTVSEGQAYGLLLAVQAGDAAAVQRIWAWTTANLQRPDGLLSWQWADGSVTDPNSASDADLYAAHALVLAGEQFSAPDLTVAGTELARAVLDHETVPTATGRILLAGNWATSSTPWVVNPSYDVPLSIDALEQAVPDPRWSELRSGSAAVLDALLAQAPLPPDWAEVAADGSVTAVDSPGGGSGVESQVGFGLDAARVVVQEAASCDPGDQEGVVPLGQVLVRDASAVRGRYDLQGEDVVDWSHPLALVAAAAAADVSADEPRVEQLLAAAAALDAEHPTYYGAAWVALGAGLLTPDATNVLGSCSLPGS